MSLQLTQRNEYKLMQASSPLRTSNLQMKKLGMIDLISVDEYSVTPKYLQIVNSVKREIESGNI